MAAIVLFVQFYGQRQSCDQHQPQKIKPWLVMSGKQH